MRVTALSVSGPRGARVTMHCRGRGCPRGMARSAVPPRGSPTVVFTHLRRLLAPGTRIEVRVTQPGLVGKFTRFVIRRRGEPRRIDRCLLPGSTAPVRC